MTVPSTFTFADGATIHRLGYGAMRLTGQPGNFGPFPNWEAGLALVQEAADLGVDFFDSARAYGPRHADKLLGEALQGRDVMIATKGGVDKPAPGRIVVDGRPETLHRQIDEALTDLRRDQIDLFQLHRVDPKTPIETSVEALAEAVADGRVARIGLSNVSLEQLKRALAVAPIASVQNRFNLAERQSSDVLDFTREKGVAFIPYGPLGANPMMAGARLDPSEAIRWLLEHSDNIVPIPGTTSIEHLRQNMAADLKEVA